MGVELIFFSAAFLSIRYRSSVLERHALAVPTFLINLALVKSDLSPIETCPGF